MATTRGRGSLRVAWAKFAESIIPLLDNVKSLGSSSKRWAAIYAVAAVFTSLLIGSVLLSSQAGELWTNASFNVNGSAYVRDDLNVTGVMYGNGSQLTGMFGGNTSAEIFNVVDNNSFIYLNKTIYVDENTHYVEIQDDDIYFFFYNNDSTLGSTDKALLSLRLEPTYGYFSINVHYTTNRTIKFADVIKVNPATGGISFYNPTILVPSTGTGAGTGACYGLDNELCRCNACSSEG